jgi:SAM-dependent methyltransferase
MTKLDRQRLQAILEAEHSVYGSTAEARNDARLNPMSGDFIGSQLDPTMRVLDIGCGDGHTLLMHSPRFASAVGVDNDPDHIRLAEEAKTQEEAKNVEFRLLDFLTASEQLDAESFDFVFTERGPVGYNSYGIQAALRVLRPNGVLFCEVIGDLHHQEMRELFGDGARANQTITSLEQVKVAMVRNGVSVRVAADIVSKRYYADIYEWLKFQCSIWGWVKAPLPSPDDIRLELFAERNTVPSGEIETTHHVVWVGGIKVPGGFAYQEFQYFEEQDE